MYCHKKLGICNIGVDYDGRYFIKDYDGKYFIKDLGINMDAFYCNKKHKFLDALRRAVK